MSQTNQRPGGKDHTRLKRGPGRGVSSDTRLELPMSPCSSLTNRNRPGRSGAPGLHCDDNGRRDVTTCVAFARGPLAATASTYVHRRGAPQNEIPLSSPPAVYNKQIKRRTIMDPPRSTRRAHLDAYENPPRFEHCFS